MTLYEYNRWILPLLQARKDGKTIQRRAGNYGPWYDLLDGHAVNFNEGKDYFRIKPESVLQPWTMPEQVPHSAVFKHKTKCNAPMSKVVGMSSEGIWLCSSDHDGFRAYETLAAHYEWTNDYAVWHPCGTTTET